MPRLQGVIVSGAACRLRSLTVRACWHLGSKRGGLRLGEIIAGEWRDVELGARRLTYTRADGDAPASLARAACRKLKVGGPEQRQLEPGLVLAAPD
jgi:hypothetical protein